MSYRFPIEELENHLPKNKHTKLRTEHKHFKDGKLIKTVNSNLEFNGEKWIDQSGLYYVCNSNYNEKYDWNSSNEIEYIESNAEITLCIYQKKRKHLLATDSLNLVQNEQFIK